MSSDILELMSAIAAPILLRLFAIIIVFVVIVTMKAYFPKE